MSTQTVTLPVRLCPTPDQEKQLKQLLSTTNEVKNYLSSQTFESETYRITDGSAPRLYHDAFYYLMREAFPEVLSQTHIRSLADVLASYRSAKANHHHLTKPAAYRRFSSISLDMRLFSVPKRCPIIPMPLKSGKPAVLVTVAISGPVKGKRLLIEAVVPDVLSRKSPHNPYLWKSAKLCLSPKGHWHLHVAVDVPAPEVVEAKSWIGVDLGIVVIASTSTGKTFSGKVIDDKRKKHQTQVDGLQKVDTRSARRKLRHKARDLSNFIRTLNHTISKRLVQEAQRSGAGLVFENLKHIYKAMKARKPQRTRMFGWSYHQLQQFVIYKAKIAGVPVKFIDPAYTSQTCSSCGYQARDNRKGIKFLCQICEFEDHADINAAKNIARIGAYA